MTPAPALVVAWLAGIAIAVLGAAASAADPATGSNRPGRCSKGWIPPPVYGTPSLARRREEGSGPRRERTVGVKEWRLAADGYVGGIDNCST